MALQESIVLVFDVLLSILGVLVIILILSVYRLYRTMKINRTVMTPMLLVGVLITLQGFTELIEHYIGEIGHIVHGAMMILGAVFFLYGIYGYHQMLKRASQAR